MQFTEKRNLTRWIIIISSFLIASLILWNTYVFFQTFKEEERNKMELWATALKNLRNADVNADIQLPTFIIENNKNIPFDIKRVFWSYHTPDNVVRGRHAHHETEMVLIAALGRIVVNTEMPDGQLNVFSLESPNQGLYLPKYCWHIAAKAPTFFNLGLRVLDP